MSEGIGGGGGGKGMGWFRLQGENGIERRERRGEFHLVLQSEDRI